METNCHIPLGFAYQTVTKLTAHILYVFVNPILKMPDFLQFESLPFPDRHKARNK